MIFCKNCGNKVDGNFCSKCGAKIDEINLEEFNLERCATEIIQLKNEIQSLRKELLSLNKKLKSIDIDCDDNESGGLTGLLCELNVPGAEAIAVASQAAKSIGGFLKKKK